MEWIEWVSSHDFRQFILDNGVFFWLLFLARVVVVTALELVVPARRISYRSVIVEDVTAFLFYQFVVFSVAGVLSSYVAIRASIPETIMALPVGSLYGVFHRGRLWSLLDASITAYPLPVARAQVAP